MPHPDVPPPDKAAKARQAHVINAAHRAAEDPARLARSTRIVRAALARQRLALADLTPLPLSPEEDEIDKPRRAVRARAGAHIAEVIQSAPPLTPEALDRLRQLLPPPTREEIRQLLEGNGFGDSAA